MYAKRSGFACAFLFGRNWTDPIHRYASPLSSKKFPSTSPGSMFSSPSLAPKLKTSDDNYGRIRFYRKAHANSSMHHVVKQTCPGLTRTRFFISPPYYARAKYCCGNMLNDYLQCNSKQRKSSINIRRASVVPTFAPCKKGKQNRPDNVGHFYIPTEKRQHCSNNSC